MTSAQHPALLAFLLSLPVAVHAESAAEIVHPNQPGVSAPLGGEDCDDHDGSPDLVVEPRLNLSAVLGHTDLEHAGLARGGHDPAVSGFSVPGLSLGMDVIYGEHLAGFSEGVFSWSRDDGWQAELEELYVKFLNLPGGLEVHAGRFFASVGTQNDIHNHGWKFADAYLGNVRFLGDDGLILEGAEVTWSPPSRWDDRLTVGFGDTLHRDHSHGSHGGDGHGDEHDDHGHGDDDHHRGHGEAEEALWDRNVLAVRYQATQWPADTRKFVYGASYVQGRNFTGGSARLYGLDVTYTWLEDEDHGKQLTWRNEAMLRRVRSHGGSFEEFSFSSTALYHFNPQWEIGLRYEYLEGADELELPERHRVSPALTRYFEVGFTQAMLRLQYNYDHSEERGGDHSAWLQFGFEWGAGGHAHVH